MDDIITIDNIERQPNRCGSCIHMGYQVGDQFEHGRQMICKRYPPLPAPVHLNDRLQVAIFWPFVQANDNCGEYRAP